MNQVKGFRLPEPEGRTTMSGRSRWAELDGPAHAVQGARRAIGTGGREKPEQAVDPRTLPLRIMEIRREKIDQHLVSLIAPASQEAEQYRELCHQLERRHRAG